LRECLFSIVVSGGTSKGRVNYRSAMDIDKLMDAFHRIVASVRSENDLNCCWDAILNITGQTGNETLAKADIRADLSSITLQLTSAIQLEPIPSTIKLLWFGLFDARQGEKKFAGYYFAGWANETQIQEGGPSPYFPAHRYLTSTLLNTVKDESCRFSGRDDQFSVLDYAVMFGAAATLSKFAAQNAGIQLPIYVGFDSGDFACIKRSPN
jgi:hypothetical protein